MATALAPETVVERSSNRDEALFEIVDGQRVDLPPMGILSNAIAGELYFELKLYLRTHPIGRATVEALLILDEEADTRRRPDVAFVSAEQWPLDRPIPETGDWHVIPELAIEVASPNDNFSDAVGKIGEYFAHGVRETWQVIPEEQQVYVYTSPTDVRILAGDKSLETPLLPGLSIPLASVFALTASSRSA